MKRQKDLAIDIALHYAGIVGVEGPLGAYYGNSPTNTAHTASGAVEIFF